MEQKPSFFKNWLALRRFKRLIKRVESLAAVPVQYENDAVVAEKKIVDEQVNYKLSTTTADVLKRYRSGARFQPISYMSIRNLEQMPVNQLSNIC